MQEFDMFDETLRKRLSLIEKNPTAQLWKHIVADLDANSVEQTLDIFDDVFKTRLASIEQTPSAQLWDTIAVDIEKNPPLDEFDRIFVAKLAEVTKKPNPNLWERIESDTNLNTGNNTDEYKTFWQNKFHSYQPSVDASVWKKIVHTLDDDIESNINSLFKKRIANLEVQPHPRVWELIVTRLDRGNRKGIFLLPRFWHRLFFVVIGIACLTVGQYLSPTTQQASDVVQPTQDVFRAILPTKPIEKGIKSIAKNSAIAHSTEGIRQMLAAIKIDTIHTISMVEKHSVSISDSVFIPSNNQSFDKSITPIIGNHTVFAQNTFPAKMLIGKDTLGGTPILGYNNTMSAKSRSIIIIDTANKSGISYLPFLDIQPLNVPFTLDTIRVSDAVINSTLAEYHPHIKNIPSIYIGIMPLMTYHNLSPIPASINPINNHEIKNIMYLNKFSRQRLGLQFGGGAELALSKRLSIRTGVTYSRLTQRLMYTYKDLSDINVRDSSKQAITFGPVADIKSEQNQHIELLGLQLGLRYDFFLRPKSVQSVIGSLESAAQVHVYDNKNSVGPFVSESLNFANLSYRAARKIGTSNYLWVETKTQIPLSSYLDNNRDIRIRPSSIGLNIGVSWLLDGKSIINMGTLRQELTNSMK